MWVKLSFNHSRQMLLFWKKKMVNEGLRRFFLVNGKRIRQLQQRFACLKKATFRLLFFCWFGEKMRILFLVVFCFTKRTKWESSKQHSPLVKRQQNKSQSLILFSQKEQHTPISFHFCKKNTKAEKCMKAGTTLQRWEANRQQNTFIWTYFFSRYIRSSEGEVHTLNWSCSMSKWSPQNAWANAFAHF